jgi:hypothetical protein
MKISYYQIVSPFVGGAVGWLAARGLSLTPDQTTALTGLAAGALAAGVHIVESWIGPKTPPPAPIVTIAGKPDPAKPGPAGGTPKS